MNVTVMKLLEFAACLPALVAAGGLLLKTILARRAARRLAKYLGGEVAGYAPDGRAVVTRDGTTALTRDGLAVVIPEEKHP